MFRFENVEALWLLLLLPGLWVVLWVSRRMRAGRIRAFGCAESIARLMPTASTRRFWFRHTLYLLGLGLVILALARPQFGLVKADGTSRGSEIMVVLDVSRSMLAEDVKPSRLERAKLEISKLVRTMKRDRVGLVLFAGRAYVQLPITSDYAAAEMFLQSVGTDMIEEQGTELGSALHLALQSFGPERGMGRAIIVISDGEDHEGEPITAAREAADLGVTIHCVGIGSPTGAPIPVAQGGVLKDHQGEVVVSRLDERVLSEVAAETGGMYLRAAGYQASLDPLIERIEKLEKGEFEKNLYSRYDEKFQWPLLAGLLLIVVTSLVFERKNSWLRMEKVLGSRWRQSDEV